MEETYVLKLYVTGRTERSTRAAEDVRALCDSELAGRFELEVIDVLEHPRIAEDEGVMATPRACQGAPRTWSACRGCIQRQRQSAGGPGHRTRQESPWWNDCGALLQTLSATWAVCGYRLKLKGGKDQEVFPPFQERGRRNQGRGLIPAVEEWRSHVNGMRLPGVAGTDGRGVRAVGWRLGRRWEPFSDSKRASWHGRLKRGRMCPGLL